MTPEMLARFHDADTNPATAYELGRRDGALVEREACAKLMEGTPPPGQPGWADGDFFCRMVDHAQGNCDCADRAAAIRARGGEQSSAG